MPISAEIKKCKKMAEETGRSRARRKDYALCGKNFRSMPEELPKAIRMNGTHLNCFTVSFMTFSYDGGAELSLGSISSSSPIVPYEVSGLESGELTRLFPLTLDDDCDG